MVSMLENGGKLGPWAPGCACAGAPLLYIAAA